MPGETLWTKDHGTVMRWAEERHAVPAIASDAAHDEEPTALRFDLPSSGEKGLVHISWDQFFRIFDAYDLMFVYQETRRTGAPSTFFRFDRPPA